MAGLDKIIKQILDDASSEANEIMKKAEGEAASVTAKAEEECLKIREDGEEKVKALLISGQERGQSSAMLKKRQLVLLAKQEMISQMVEKSHKVLLAQEDSAYFTMIKKMIGTFALAKSGEICFSRKDLDRMPSDFEQEMETIAQEKGGHLRLSEEGRSIDGGFILIYGGVEENCSFKAIMDARKDQIADKIQELLFL